MSKAINREKVTARIEDLEWMDAAGETLAGAAARLGISREGLAKWMDSHDLKVTKERMANREFIDQDRVRKHDNRVYTRHRRAAA